MASPFQTAQSIYLALKDDVAAVAEIRAEYKNLAKSIALNPNFSFELISSTVNGQSFSGTRSMTNGQRLQLLTLVVKMLDNESIMSTRTRPVH